jgi:hypothetical protein
VSCVRLLLESAAVATTRNRNNQTPYNVANLRGHQQIALLLLEFNQQLGGSTAGLSNSPQVPKPGKILREHSMSSLDGSDDSNFSIDITVSPNKKQGSKLSANAQTFDYQQQQLTPVLKRKVSDEQLPRPHTASPSLSSSSRADLNAARSPLLVQQRNPLINSAREAEPTRYLMFLLCQPWFKNPNDFVVI